MMHTDLLALNFKVDEHSKCSLFKYIHTCTHTHVQSNIHTYTNKSLYNICYAETIPSVFIILWTLFCYFLYNRIKSLFSPRGRSSSKGQHQWSPRSRILLTFLRTPPTNRLPSQEIVILSFSMAPYYKNKLLALLRPAGSKADSQRLLFYARGQREIFLNSKREDSSEDL